MRWLLICLSLAVNGCVHHWPDREWCDKHDRQIAKHRRDCHRNHKADAEARLFCYDVTQTSEEMSDIICHEE